MITSSARFRDASAVLVIALFTGLLTLAPPIDRLRGLSIDILTALRWRVFGAMHEPQTSPTVVVALDEETYRTPPFVGTPAITWTPEIGQVLTAVIAGGAKVVGFDIVFPTSIEQSEIPFGDGTLGGRLRSARVTVKWCLARRNIAISRSCRRPVSASPSVKMPIFAP